MADIGQCEDYSFYTYSTGRAVHLCQNIDEIYPITNCDTLYFEVCIFLRVSSNCFTVMITRQSRAELVQRIISLNCVLKWDVICRSEKKTEKIKA